MWQLELKMQQGARGEVAGTEDEVDATGKARDGDGDIDIAIAGTADDMNMSGV